MSSRSLKTAEWNACRWLAAAAIALVLVGIAAYGVPANAQTPASQSKSCGYEGGSACADEPPTLGPWVWGFQGPYGLPQVAPPFHSLDDIINWYQGYNTGQQTGTICSATLASQSEGPTGHWISTAPVYESGYETSDQYTLNFNVTGDAPQCNNSWVVTFYVGVQRTLGCPANTNPYTGSDGTLRCAVPGQDLGKRMGPSPATQTAAGDPVNVANQNIYRSDTDYRGTGENALQFIRSYNSSASWFPMYFGTQELGLQVLGVAWSATYFQHLLPMIACPTSNTCYTSGVHAYRPDGGILTFNQPPGQTSPTNGVFSGPADFNDSLIQTNTGWVYQTADDTIETYNSDGTLLSVTVRGKPTVTVNYANADPLPTSVSDPFGHTLQFAYLSDATGTTRLASVTDPAGQSIQYGYGSNGALLSVTHQDGTERQYSYLGSGFLTYSITGITDEAGVTAVTWSSNSAYGPATSQLAGGVNNYSFSESYSGSSASINVTDPLGTTRTYPQSLIQGVYRTTGVNTPCIGCGEDQSRAFDANGNVTRRTDFNGNVTTYGFDPIRNLELSRTEASGTAQARTISTSWNASWNQPALITEPNRTTAFSYDGNGNLLSKTVTDTSVTPNVSRAWSFTYDSYGRMLTAQGPRTDVNSTTTYNYYTCTTGRQCGQLHTVTDAAGHVTTFNTYNAHGQPLTVSDPNGVVSILTYDARQRLIARQVSSETTGFAYSSTGLLQTVTLPDGSTLQYTYDAASQLTQVQDSLGNSIQYTLDAMGNRIAESHFDSSDTLSLTLSSVYNGLNELGQQIASAGTEAVTTTFGYDSNGNQTSANAPLSRDTTNVFDPLNRLSQITDANSGETQLGYDANDNLVSVNDPSNLTTSYQYNGFGDLLQLVSPATGTTANTYDSGGNLATSTDARGVTSVYGYDALNRLTQVAYGDQTIVYTYDARTNGKGHLTGASDSLHSMSWQYDAMGRVTLKSQTVANITRSVGYAYTTGDLTALTTPSGQTITYGYANHQVTGIALNGVTLLSTVVYEPFGPARGWTWGNGTSEVRLHDTDGNPSQITGAESTSYSLDSASRIVGIANATNPTLSWTDGYDNLDRLTSASANTAALNWTYDADGNRLTQAGSSAADGAAGFTYNNRGRLISATTTLGVMNAIYNALGQRIEKANTQTVTLFIYDESGHLIGEYDGSGNLIEETVWLGDLPVATLQPNGSGGINVFYIHADHLNTPKAITKASGGAIVWRWDQDPFGAATPNQNPSGLGTFVYNLRFPGQYYDQETGLSYNYYRDLDTSTGRYVESDPIGLNGGSYSTYNYVGGNPISNIDPRGLCKVELRFKRVTFLMGGIDTDFMHGYIVTTDLDGSQKYFRGGPGGTNKGSSYGNVVTESGTYNNKSKDYSTEPRPSQTLLDDGESCSCMNKQFSDILNRIQQATVPYEPFPGLYEGSANSNSVAGTLIRDAGLTSAPVNTWVAPGFNHNVVP